MNTGKKILLIDDDTRLKSLISLFLKRANYEFCYAETGEDGLEMILEERPAAILLDRILPNMSGDEVLSRLRTDVKYQSVADTPVIVFTALSENETRRQVYELGANAYLIKPITFETLINEVERLVYQHQRNLNQIKLSELNIESNRRFYEALIQHIHEIVFTMSEKGYITFVNPRINDMLGYFPSDVVGHHFSEYVYVEDISIAKNALQNLLQTGQTQYIELRMIHKEGRLLYMNVSGKMIRLSDGIVITGLARDVTTQRNLEMSMQQYTENMETIIAKRTRTLEKTNREIMYLFEVIMKIIQSDATSDKIQLICDALTIGNFYQYAEVRVFDLDGHEIYYAQSENNHQITLPHDVSTFSFNRKNGTVLGQLKAYNPTNYFSDEMREVVKLFIDVVGISIERSELATENQTINQELVRRKNELEELNLLKSEFMNTVSHELRTPLTIIIGYLDILQRGIGGDLQPNQGNMLSIMRQNASKLHQRINDILDFSRIKLNGLSVSHEPCAVPQIILKAITRINELIPVDKKLDITYNYPHDLPQILLDRNKVDRVLNILLENAVKFTESGAIRLTADHDDKYIYFRVIDTGKGIPYEDSDKIFEPFQQGDGSDQREHDGVGLGLTFAKKLIELDEGKIRFESEVGKGTTFIVSFPLRKVEVS